MYGRLHYARSRTRIILQRNGFDFLQKTIHGQAQHGLALCEEEYTRRYGKTHALESKILSLYSLPLPHFQVHDVSDVFDTRKVAYYDIPEGLSFIPLAINDDVFYNCAEYDGEHILGISTYKNYYISKRYTMKRKMLWAKQDKIPKEFSARKKVKRESE